MSNLTGTMMFNYIINSQTNVSYYPSLFDFYPYMTIDYKDQTIKISLTKDDSIDISTYFAAPVNAKYPYHWFMKFIKSVLRMHPENSFARKYYKQYSHYLSNLGHTYNSSVDNEIISYIYNDTEDKIVSLVIVTHDCKAVYRYNTEKYSTYFSLLNQSNMFRCILTECNAVGREYSEIQIKNPNNVVNDTLDSSIVTLISLLLPDMIKSLEGKLND